MINWWLIVKAADSDLRNCLKVVSLVEDKTFEDVTLVFGEDWSSFFTILGNFTDWIAK